MRFLQAIEEDELDRIPGVFFVRAILRSYARAIGIDEHQVLNRYREMQAFAEHQQERERMEVPSRRPPPPALSRKWIWPAAAVIAVAAIGLSLLYLFPGRAEPERSALVETSLPSDNPVGLPEAGSEPAAAEEVEGLRLQFDFIEETWLHVYSDGESVWDGIKTAGESIGVAADREVLLNIGNAGGFHLTINGKKARSFGPRGAVRTNIRITSENQGEFIVADKPDES